MEITYYANEIKTLTLNPQCFAKGQCVCGWKIDCGTEVCTVLRKAQEFSKAKASIIQGRHNEHYDHFNISYGKAFISKEHRFTSAHSQCYFLPTVLSCPSHKCRAGSTLFCFSWPAEATRAARDSRRAAAQGASSLAAAQLPWPGQLGFPQRPRVPRGWSKQALDDFALMVQGQASSISNNPAMYNLYLLCCAAENRRAL